MNPTIDRSVLVLLIRAGMRFGRLFVLSAIVLFIVGAFSFSSGLARQSGRSMPQQKPTRSPTPQPSPGALVRKSTKHEVRTLGYGGTVSIIGAPMGSISIESWNRNEVDITADIEIRADSEEDLSTLAIYDTFIVDSTENHFQILTTGTHDLVFMKRTVKKFPKNLLGIPFRIDYKLKVPSFVDLDIDAGTGSFDLSGVEGTVSYKSQKSDVKVDMNGGALRIVVGTGTVNLKINSRSWRGVGCDVQVGAGDLNVESLAGFNADIDAVVLRLGKIEQTLGTIAPLPETTQSDHALHGRAGSGGAHLSFTVGDGVLRIKKISGAHEYQI